MITIISDAEWKGWKMALTAACILSGAALACLVMADKTARAEQRARDKCVDTVYATEGSRDDLDKCLKGR